MLGKQSIQFERKPYIISSASIVGSKEAEGPMGSFLTRSVMMTALVRKTGRRRRAVCRKRH